MARLKPLPRSQRYIYTTPPPNRGEARRRDKLEQKNVEVINSQFNGKFCLFPSY